MDQNIWYENIFKSENNSVWLVSLKEEKREIETLEQREFLDKSPKP